MTRWPLLLLALAACETDDFFITDGSDVCPTDAGETEPDPAPTTSSVMSEPLAEISTVPVQAATPPDPTLPGLAPAQEPP